MLARLGRADLRWICPFIGVKRHADFALETTRMTRNGHQVEHSGYFAFGFATAKEGARRARNDDCMRLQCLPLLAFVESSTIGLDVVLFDYRAPELHLVRQELRCMSGPPICIVICIASIRLLIAGSRSASANALLKRLIQHGKVTMKTIYIVALTLATITAASAQNQLHQDVP